MRTLTLVGAGPVGVAAASAAVDAGAVDGIAVVVDPDDENRAAAVARLGGPGCPELPGCAVLSELALVAFSSRMESTLPTLEVLLERGVSVVTTCEELSDPPAQVRARLDGAARASKRVVVATGANPGFVMDRLPLVVAGGSMDIRRIDVVRRLDTRTRRPPLVAKTGRGMTMEEFTRGVGEGRVGHVGLDVSGRLVADGLGWSVEREESSIGPATAGGAVIGVHQTYTAVDENGRELHYDLTMAWGIDDPFDRITVEGEPRVVVELPGGYHGDLGTTARVVRALQAVQSLPPGFYRPTDLPPSW